MGPIVLLKTAVGALASNKLRASLTLLGIVIGVASVITLMAIGRGAQENVTSRISDLGTDLVFVRPGASLSGGIFLGQGSALTLTLDDAESMGEEARVPSAAKVAPEVQSSGQLAAQGNNTFTSIVGATSEYLEVRGYDLATGRGITVADVLNRTEVAILGSSVSESLYDGRNPVGSTVRINGREFTVIGVLESRGGSGLGLEDDQVLVPLTTAAYRLERNRTTGGEIALTSITIQAKDSGSVDDLVAEVTSLLRINHRIDSGENNDFTVTTQQDTIDTLAETQQTFVIFLAAIASISLLVGGIGIMNIMLVSVTERTREIGIRRAVGAKRRDILTQFITEATLLSVGGGLLGVALGAVLSIVINGRTLGDNSFTTVLSTDVALLALAVSAAIGLFFGIYPAGRAASLDPVEALRHQ